MTSAVVVENAPSPTARGKAPARWECSRRRKAGGRVGAREVHGSALRGSHRGRRGLHALDVAEVVERGLKAAAGIGNIDFARMSQRNVGRLPCVEVVSPRLAPVAEPDGSGRFARHLDGFDYRVPRPQHLNFELDDGHSGLRGSHRGRSGETDCGAGGINSGLGAFVVGVGAPEQHATQRGQQLGIDGVQAAEFGGGLVAIEARVGALDVVSQPQRERLFAHSSGLPDFGLLFSGAKARRKRGPRQNVFVDSPRLAQVVEDLFGCVGLEDAKVRQQAANDLIGLGADHFSLSGAAAAFWHGSVPLPFGDFLKGFLAGLDLGRRRGQFPPVKRGLNAIGDAGWQLVGPERDSSRADPNCSGRLGRCATQEGDGFGFVHAPMLVHLPPWLQVDLQPSLIKYTYMKTLAERTEEAIAEGFTVGALAAAAGKTSAAVSLWRSGKTKEIKADSAIGLQKLTGWSWTWWVTGKGERGPTKSTPDEPALVSALRVLGSVLAQNMPDDVREDVGELLKRLSLRRGSERHQAELVSLLAAVEATQVVPAQLDGRLDLDHATSQHSAEHASAPQVLGGNKRRERGNAWHTTDVGTPADVARSRTGASRQRKPGEKPAAGKTSNGAKK